MDTDTVESVLANILINYGFTSIDKATLREIVNANGYVVTPKLFNTIHQRHSARVAWYDKRINGIK